MILRRQQPADAEAVRVLFSTVTSDTFFDNLHADQAWLPALSFVALNNDGDVVGHVAATRGQVGSAPALALVPPSVDPAQRGQGVGQALMHAVLGAAEAQNEPLVGLVAIPPEYFSRFGFQPAEDYGIVAPCGRVATLLSDPPSHRLHPLAHRHLQLPRTIHVRASHLPVDLAWRTRTKP